MLGYDLRVLRTIQGSTFSIISRFTGFDLVKVNAQKIQDLLKL